MCKYLFCLSVLFLIFFVFPSKQSQCDKEESQKVLDFLNDHVYPLIEAYNSTLPKQCPFHPEINQHLKKLQKKTKEEVVAITSYPQSSYYVSGEFCFSNLCDIFLCCGEEDFENNCNQNEMSLRKQFCQEIMFTCFGQEQFRSTRLYGIFNELICHQLDCYERQYTGEKLGEKLDEITQKKLASGKNKGLLTAFGLCVIISILGYLIKSSVSDGNLREEIGRYKGEIILLIILVFVALATMQKDASVFIKNLIKKN
ncbi:hypothetical protein M0813_25342 [Anaeramoeba flamelloides]|uniref:Transmembrane protein n=1 Tax=Anaeramoeba flamelloides TaxID=1746091 RepID=A0ABQ8Y3E2_9EUKA|nr:hypothetical protein M0813_25342 [Anaeramoeba flamelloides]